MTAPEITPAPESPAVGGPVQRQVRPAAWLARRSDWPAGMWEAFKGEAPPAWASGADPLYTTAAVQALVATERQRWIAKAGATYTDAHAIFNDPPSETPQVVRDVIEWHLHAMRANEEA